MHNLTKIRQEKNLSQADLAKLLGVTRAGISYIEKNSLNIKTAEELSKILKVSIFELLGEDSFAVLPKDHKDKKYLIKLIKGM